MTSRTEHPTSKARVTPARALLYAVIGIAWTFLAYLSVMLSAPRLLPSDQVDPIPIANVIYAMTLIYLPIVAAAAATVLTRSGNDWRRGIAHAAAMLAFVVFLLAFAFS